MVRVLLLCALCVMGQCALAQEVSKQQTRELSKIVTAFIDAATSREQYCVFGEYIVPNLSRNDSSEPLEVSSDYFVLFDAQERYHRFSSLHNVWNSNVLVYVEGQWFSRVLIGEKQLAGYDRLLHEIKETPNPEYNSLPPLGLKTIEPWSLTLGVEGDYDLKLRPHRWLFESLEPSKAVDVQRARDGLLAVFQIREGARMLVFFSEKHGYMPVRCEHRLQDRYVQQRYGGREPGTDEYSWLVSTVETRWKLHKGEWFPVICTLNRYATKRSKPNPSSAFQIEFNWILNSRMIGELSNPKAHAEDLWFVLEDRVEVSPR